MSTSPLTRNITAAFRLATDGDRAAGYGWYARARDLAEQIADGQLPVEPDEIDREVRRAAGVIAALSPRLAWRKNVEYAKLAYVYHQSVKETTIQILPKSGPIAEAYFAGMMPVMKANARKAWRILEGEDPEDVLGGPKVRAFYFTITNPSDPRSVVVDRHAVSAAYNRPLSDTEIGKALGRKGAYDSISTLYQRASRIISRELGEVWTPAQTQAAVWTYWRRERALAYHGEEA